MSYSPPTDSFHTRYTLINENYRATDGEAYPATFWHMEERKYGRVDRETGTIRFGSEVIDAPERTTMDVHLSTTYTQIVGYFENRTTRYHTIHQYRFRTRNVIE